MEGKARLLKYVRAVCWRLRFEQFVYIGQTGLLIATLLAVVVIAASRLFVLPYYGQFALGAAGCAVIMTIVYLIYKRFRHNEAIHRLDSYMPDNLLITALGIDEKDTHLASALIRAAETEVGNAFEGFKKRKTTYLNPRMLAGLVGLSTALMLLLLFPSEAQIEANAVVDEKEIIEEVKQDVQEIIEQESLSPVKKELQELAEKLQQAETSEEVLKELVKKQKEIRLKEKRLADDKERSASSEDTSETWTATKERELEALRKISDELAKNMGKAHTALNHIGKAPSLPALANAGNEASIVEEEETGSLAEESAREGQSDGNGQGNEETDSGMDNGEGQSQGGGQSQDQGQSQGEGQGQGQGQGQSQGSGQGSGVTAGGSGVGKEAGGRNLLSVPNHRVGEKEDPSVVGGNLGEGEFLEERETEGPVERGTIRPYEEVVGHYKDSYLQSMERMRLPPDLQDILSDYFTSIE